MDIKKLRGQNGLTQTELGLKLWPNISEAAAQGRIKRIEAGDRSLTKTEQWALNKFFGQLQSRQQTDYEKVITKYPEIEAAIKILSVGLEQDPVNAELIYAGWSSLKVISEQKMGQIKTKRSIKGNKNVFMER